MPSICTHHLFGQKVLQKYGRAFQENVNTQDAFIMGCQGPDPFFFAALGTHPKNYLRFGQLLHGVNVTQSFEQMFAFQRVSSGETRDILFAYLTGYLCHYALDRTTHPYIYSVQNRICKEMGLSDDRAHIHMRLETAIDYLMTGQTENPSSLIPRNRKVCMVISNMFQTVSFNVYGIALSKSCYWRAIRCTRIVERFLKSRKGIKRKLLSGIERIFTRYSMYDAMSLSEDTKGLEDPLNLKKQGWEESSPQKYRCESFEELFHMGILQAVSCIKMFSDGEQASKITVGMDFNGGAEEQKEFSVNFTSNPLQKGETDL